jgi:phospholipase/carboxylesterase
MATLDVIETQSGKEPHASLIWLHGLGADGHDFADMLDVLGLDGPVRLICPHAPYRAVTLNFGIRMRAWYDILSIDGPEREIDERGLDQSRLAIRELIARENERGIACNKIVLLGFSQGGALAYYTGLTHAEPLAGIVGLSTYIPNRTRLAAERENGTMSTPVFAAHGDSDPVVPLSMGLGAAQLIEAGGNSVLWQRYPGMEHAVCEDEMAALSTWLNQHLSFRT